MITVKYLQDDAPLSVRSMLYDDGETFLSQCSKALHDGWYVDAARIDTDDLDYAYALMQNGVHSDSWTLAPPSEVTPLLAPINHGGQLYGNRSAMIGDLFEQDGTLHACAAIGFQPLPPPTAESRAVDAS